MSRHTKHACNGPGCDKSFFGWQLEAGWIEGGRWFSDHKTVRVDVLFGFDDQQPDDKYDPDELLDWCSEECLVAYLKQSLAEGGQS
jgi:hypothetical protein